MLFISIQRARQALAVIAVGLAGFANAEGPVAVSALPGGGGSVVSDTDSGNGQRWGRGGGRTITYHVNNPSTFSSLRFGVVQGTAPSLAFDAAVTPSTGEVMSYTPGQSNLAGGMARWTGFANLPTVNGTIANVPTRFTITVSRTNGAAVALAVDPSGPNPMASVLTTGDFRVNLLFEMQDLNAPPGFYQPVLDYYDNLQFTIPGQPPSTNVGPVMTGVSTGFYYDVLDTGMTIEEHDAHLQALFDSITPKLNNIDGKINFLKTDWDGRIPAIQNEVGEVRNTLNNQVSPTLSQIQQQVAQLLGQGNGTGNLATKQDVQSARSELSEMLQILWGLKPCPLSPAECSQVKFIQNLATSSQVDGILIGLSSALAPTNANVATVTAKVEALEGKLDELQATLDNTAAASLDVRAVQVDSGDPKKLRWLVKTTRDGVLVNASLTRMATVRGYSNMANVMGNATVHSLGTGMHDVVLTISKDAPEGVAYLFEATLIIGPSDVVGSALVVTEKKGASPF